MMSDFFRWVLLSSLTMAVCVLVYRLVLRHTALETRRWALLLSLFGAFVLPFIKIEGLAIFPVEIIEPFWGNSPIEEQAIWEMSPIRQFQQHYAWGAILQGLYWLVTLLLGIAFLLQIKNLLTKIRQGRIVSKQGFRYVILEEIGHAAAFLNYIFISKTIWESEDAVLIAAHEQEHVRQGHSLDRLFTEILSVFQWFNPFIYWFRKDLLEVHEYLADQGVLRQGEDAIAYQQLIVKYAGMEMQAQLGNQFNHSLTLKRIKMIIDYKETARPMTWSKLLIFIPVFMGLLGLFSFQTVEYTQATEPGYILPVQKGNFKKIAGYGMRKHPVLKVKKLHTGVDFVAPEGTPVLAVKEAVVLRVQESTAGYGNNIVLKIDDEICAMYAHLSRIDVKVGDRVEKGAVIGAVGNTGASTGPHLHFEIIQKDKKVDPVDFLPNFQ